MDGIFKHKFFLLFLAYSHFFTSILSISIYLKYLLLDE